MYFLRLPRKLFCYFAWNAPALIISVDFSVTFFYYKCWLVAVCPRAEYKKKASGEVFFFQMIKVNWSSVDFTCRNDWWTILGCIAWTKKRRLWTNSRRWRWNLLSFLPRRRRRRLALWQIMTDEAKKVTSLAPHWQRPPSSRLSVSGNHFPSATFNYRGYC